FRSTDFAYSYRYNRPLPGRAKPAKEQGESAQCSALAFARNQTTGRNGEIRGPSPESDRIGRPRRKNPHLQLSAEPRYRPPHRAYSLQSGPVYGRRPRGNDFSTASCGSDRATERQRADQLMSSRAERSEVEGSRGVTLKIAHRDASTWLGMTPFAVWSV